MLERTSHTSWPAPAAHHPSTTIRRGNLRLVPTSLGLVAPYLVHAIADAPSQNLLVALHSPDSGQVSTFEPFSAVERLRGHVPDPDVEGLAVVDDRTVSLVWRNGISFRAVIPMGDPWPAPVASLHNNDDLVVDALRRAFGLPTAPVTFGPAWYWLMVWLHDLAALAEVEVIDVREAARWHPALEPDEIDDSDETFEVTNRCLDQLYEHARATRWAGVRSGAENGWLELGHCSPPLARWFDDASFARALADQLGAPEDELVRLVALDQRWTTDCIEMLRSMVAGVHRMRALDCHQ